MFAETKVKAVLSTYRYARLNGPPDEWHMLIAVDQNTMKQIDDVIEVDCDAGWMKRLQPHPTKPNELIHEIIFGRFALYQRLN